MHLPVFFNVQFLRSCLTPPGAPCFILIAGFLISAQAQLNESMPVDLPSAVIADWIAQDGTNYDHLIAEIKNSLPPKYQSNITGSGEAGYLNACHWRRVARMQPYARELKKLIFAKHYDFGGPTPGYLEDMNSDGFTTAMGRFGSTPDQSKGSNYKPGSALFMLEMNDCYSTPAPIIEDPSGVVRDPCLSFDGKRLVFAWSNDDNGYHIYELTFQPNTGVITPNRKQRLAKSTSLPASIRQLTDDPAGLTVSDYEPCVLPSGDIIFNSSRNFGASGIYSTITSNLYIMNKDGKYLRRLSYDAGSTFYPTIREDGCVQYSRWENGDRTPGCAIYAMNQDGRLQRALYGEQTPWPPLFLQTRQIPLQPMKSLAIIGGSGSGYAGNLCIIDAAKIRNGLSGLQLIVPKRRVDTSVVTMQPLFQTPQPLDEDWFLVSWRPSVDKKFNLYLMNTDGDRELIAWDDLYSVSQPISCGERQLFPVPYSITDYSKKTASMTVLDVNYGSGMCCNIPKSTVKKIRVVAIELRTGPAFGSTGSSTAATLTPVARWTGTPNAKRIIGEIPMESDGSAAFEVPPQTPLQLQLIDSAGCLIQSMRSWVTLTPGDQFYCVGCHEDKNIAPPTMSPIAREPKPLTRFCDLDTTGYFSYSQQIQPILDKNCVKSGCHDIAHSKGLDLRGELLWTGDLDDPDNRDACRYWLRSYWNLTNPTKQYVNFIACTSSVAGLPARSVGSSKSLLITKLRGSHNDVVLSEAELARLCAWIDLGIPHGGAYADDMKPTDKANYLVRLERRRQMEAIEVKNIEDFIKNGGYKQPYYSVVAGDFNIAADPGGVAPFTTSFLPVTGELVIGTTAVCRLTLIDLHGRRILTKAITTTGAVASARIHLPAGLPQGLYIVTLTGPGMHTRTKTISLF